MANCRLCNEKTIDFGKFQDREFVQCVVCQSVQVLPDYYLSVEAEKARYLLHDNDIRDPGYLDFVQPLLQKIKSEQNPQASGLDYGCGTGPIIAAELEKAGFNISLYDPYFKNDTELLRRHYEFIICCEVMEHFQNPNSSFSKLSSLLQPDGKLYCKTALYNSAINFKNWHYKNDSTHVFFYTEKSLKWIAEHLNFSLVTINPEVIIFTK